MCLSMHVAPGQAVPLAGAADGGRSPFRWPPRYGFLIRVPHAKGSTVRTFSPKDSDITRQWHVIDASDVVLGRLASQAAVLLRGKHKPIFARTWTRRLRDRHQRGQDRPHRQQAGAEAGVPALRLPGWTAGGRLRRTDGEAPERAVERPGGMLRRTRWAARRSASSRCTRADHPHQAQQPVPFEITQVPQ